MFIEVSTMIGCKNNCNFCPQDTIISQYSCVGGKSLLPMTLPLFKKCILKLPLGCHIIFSGMCEPWLNPDCTEMVEFAYSNGYFPRIYTTLVNMKLRDIDRLSKLSFPQDEHGFVVHLPSVGGIENIVVDSHYLESLEHIYESPLPVRYHYHGAALHPDVEKFFRQRVGLVEKFPAHSRAGNLDDYGRVRRRIGKIGCIKKKLSGAYGHVLLPNGLLLLCCQDYGMKHVVGNLLTQSFNEILEGDAVKEVERGMKNSKVDILCRTCEYSYDSDFVAEMFNQKCFLPDHQG